MTKDFFKGKRITVFGIGLLGGGVGTIKFLVENGAHVIATDIKTKEQLTVSLEQLRDFKNIEYVLGQHRVEDFTSVDMVIKTPVAPWTNKHIKLAQEHGVPVEVDSSLFMQLCKNPVIGITGTKGKTTTSHIVYDILQHAGKHPVKVGVGQTSVLDRLNVLKKDSVVVFEMSSWRLSGLAHLKKSPQIAVFTNLFPDHLNYYKSMEAYRKDKEYIFRFQKKADYVIGNYDDVAVRDAITQAPSQIVYCSRGIDAPAPRMFLNGDMVMYQGAQDEDLQKVLSIKELSEIGRHNLSNILTAAAATHAQGVSLTQIAQAVKNFKGVAHRLEHVRTVDDVRYFNDTTATIPDAAIRSMRAFDEPVLLIAGGSDKGIVYDDFAQAILADVKGVVFIKGKGTDKTIRAMRKMLPEEERERTFEVYDSMEKAVESMSRSAAAGDVVLLAPGAASFGVFRNEFDRGNQFKSAVEAL